MKRNYTLLFIFLFVLEVFPQGVDDSLMKINHEKDLHLKAFCEKPTVATTRILTSDILPPQGTGTESNPFLIENLGNLLWVALSPDQWDKFYLQTTDIDASETSEWWYNGNGWLPIGTQDIPFTGYYDGNNYVITNLVINRPTNQYQGFFGWNNGTIVNLGLVNADITDHGSRAGILAGINNLGNIDNCYSTGSIKTNSADGRIGGLVGWNNSEISNSWSSADVNSLGSLNGGLVGSNNGGTVINCYATGNVTGSTHVGGLAGGVQNSAIIENSFATGNVSGQNAYYVGGLSGTCITGSEIHNSYSTGSAEGSFYIGGLVGYASNVSIINSYTVAMVTGNFNTGGLVGYAEMVETFSSYWNIETTFQSHSEVGSPKTTAEMLIESTYEGWDFTATWTIQENMTYPYLYIQEDAGEFNYPSEFLPPYLLSAEFGDNVISLEWMSPSLDEHLGFNVYRNEILIATLGANETQYIDQSAENFVFYTYKVTAIYDNNQESFPVSVTLFATPGFAMGDGTEENPYLVSNAGELFTVRLDLLANYQQTADIDLDVAPFNEGAGWTPIGNEIDAFGGNYNGDGYIISGLYINRPEENFIGLFGRTINVSLNNIHLGNADILGYNRVGSLIGSASLTNINNCNSSGIINALNNWAGGLVGVIGNNSFVSASYSTSDVFSQGYSVGGLSGATESNSSINDSYATGNVTGSQWVGGLIGWVADCSISNSYSVGQVVASMGVNSGGLLGGSNENALIVSSYWNIEMSGQLESYGGEGKTTIEMISAETFSDWDFEEIWNIIDNESYPYLQWQIDPGTHNFPPDFYTLTININPVSAGIAEGAGDYPAGAYVDISAIPNTGFGFINWTDEGSNELSKEKNYVFQMPDQNSTITANFSEINFAGGTGSEEDPWQIETAHHLNNIRYFLGQEHQDKHFIQVADIDLGTSPWNDGKGWLPIGIFKFPDPLNENHAFTGSYNGSGFTIDGLTINRTDDRRGLGLFACTEGAYIYDLALTNTYINGFDHAGALAGSALNNTIIDNCSSTGIIEINFQIIGGLVGRLENSLIINSFSTCNVTDKTLSPSGFTGGLVGGLFSGNIENSYSTGDVSGGNSGAGGLVGSSNGGEINSCFSIGNVSAVQNTGGLVGTQWNNAIISNSYSTGNVNGDSHVGGLIGTNYENCMVLNSYSTGNVAGDFNPGGLIGTSWGEGLIINSYWNIETSGMDYSWGGEGNTTEEMLLQNTFVDWDFNEIWSIMENKTYPFLQWQVLPDQHNSPFDLYKLSLLASPEEGGIVEGSEINIYGEEVLVSATAHENYVFVNWTDSDGNEISNENSFHYIMPAEDVYLIAVFSLITSTDEVFSSEIQLFPNPFSHYINLKKSSDIQEVLITNVLGQNIMRKSLTGSDSETISTENLPKGIYLITLIDNDGFRQVIKMVKE